MNRKKATIAIMMAILIRLAFPLVSAFFLLACAQEIPRPQVNLQEATEPYSEEDMSLDEFIPVAKIRAEQGWAGAQAVLALMYDRGLGVPQDYKEAAHWYLAAAEQGFPSAQNRLARMYESGEGVTQDHQEAVRWYQEAAAQEDALAQFNLGGMYAKGEGVPQDYIQAHMWCNLAASRQTGDERETTDKRRDAIAEKMTPEQIAEAQRLAREWKPKGSGSH